MSGFGLLGTHLSHSYSPLIHAGLCSYEYRLYEKTPEEVKDFLLFGDFEGLNVTIPYKKTVIPFCTGLSDAAKEIGSVNTITRNADGSLYGDNTDYFGFSYLLNNLLKNPGVDITGGKAIILGSGGSSHTVQAVLHDSGIKEIVIVSRTGAVNYENIIEHNDAVLIVNTTPVGMYPGNGVSPIPDLSLFNKCKAVIDIIYNPARTKLLLQAEELGIPCVNGLTMLIAQAKKAAESFTESLIPDDVITRISAGIEKKTRNIVLIGMPGCGKSTIGAALAKKLHREFADTDKLVEKKAGKSIPAIFDENGEDNFRILEQEVLEELCKQSGLVISTGGGIVKRSVNRDVIRQNSIVVFLDQDIDTLPVTGRPLSISEGVAALAKERLPLYRKWSDRTFEVRGIEKTAEDIYLELTGKE